MKKIKTITIALLLIISFIVVGSNVAEAKVVKKSGLYGTMLSTKVDKYNPTGYVKKIKLKKNKIITYGSFYYGKQISSSKYLKVKKRTFKLSNKCKFLRDYTYPGKEHRISKKKEYKIIKKLMSESGGFIYFKVKNGKVSKIMTGQM